MSGAFSELIGNPIGEAAAFAAGLAIHPLIEPLLQEEKNATWSLYRSLPLDPEVAAQLVARNIVPDLGTGESEAGLSGVSTSRFGLLAQLAVEFPGLAELIELQRRAVLPSGDLTAALQRQGFTAEYAGFLAQLVDARLSPQQVALGIVRGLIADPGLMPVDLDTSGGKVPAYQVAALAALTEAADGGIDEERLRVMVGSIGLPMSTQQAASAFFRGIIAQGDFNRSILEGDVRPEWAPFILEQARQILSVDQWVELNLRGYATKAEMYAGVGLHGMSQADADNLFDVKGRPLAVHQITTGLARGGTYNGTTDAIPDEYLAAIKESNIRPEYYNLAYANRYTLPSAFVLKSLATSGDLTQAQSENLLLEIGWPPDLAASVSAVWAGGTGTTAAQKKQTLSHLTAEYLSGALTADALTTVLTTSLGYTAQQAADEIALANFNAAKSSRTKATKNLEKRYIGATLSEADARSQLAGIGWPEGAIDQFIASWNIERADTLTTLTLAQIQTALKNAAIPASVARPLLEDLGESADAIATIFATYGTDPNT